MCSITCENSIASKSGSPGKAPAAVLETVTKRAEKMLLAREETCKRVAARLGL